LYNLQVPVVIQSVIHLLTFSGASVASVSQVRATAMLFGIVDHRMVLCTKMQRYQVAWC